MPALVGLVMVQLVLSGALVAVDGRPVLEQVAWLAPARWGFAGSAVSVDLHKPRRLGGVDTDPLLAHNAGQWLADLTALGVLCALALGLGLWLVRRALVLLVVEEPAARRCDQDVVRHNGAWGSL